MENEPKISTPEAILWIILAVIADLLSIIPVVNWIVWIIMVPATWLYFKMKGVQSKYAAIGSIIEVIPVISALPGYTVEMIVAIYMDRHPNSKLAKVANAASAVNIKNPKKALSVPAQK